jgi:sugar-specific transcriptional regulator TrmB
MLENFDVISIIQKVGLSPKASKAYLALIQLQKANPHQIAKAANIERTSIYPIMDELVEKQLAEKILVGKRINFFASPPDRLEQLAKEQAAGITKILPMLLGMQGKLGDGPVIKHYENKNSIKEMLLRSLDHTEPVRREYALVENVVAFLGSRFASNYISKRVKQGIRLKSIRHTPTKKVQNLSWYLKEDNQDLLREIRYLDEPIPVSPWVLIYDNLVTIISSEKESFALSIESQEFSKFMKSIFDITWQVATPPPT